MIFYLSSLPPGKVPSFPDFIPHFIEYFILAILVFLTLKEHSFTKAFQGSFFWGLFYAFTDEFHQIYVPGRQATLKDWLVDALGVTCGVLLIRYFDNRAQNSKGYQERIIKTTKDST